MLGGRVLVDAVAQVEDVAGSLSGAHVWHAEALEQTARFMAHLRRWREQHGGIEVALQGLAVTDQGARLGQAHGPVQPQHIAADVAHL